METANTSANPKGGNNVRTAERFRWGYQSPEEVRRRHSMRRFRRNVKRFGFALLGAVIWIGALQVNAYRTDLERKTQQRFAEYGAQVSRLIASHSRMERNPLWGRLLSSEWSALTRVVNDARVGLQQKEEERIAAAVREGDKALPALQTQMAELLRQKVVERCPQHPGSDRAPEDRYCQWDGYRFPFWKEGSVFHWREGRSAPIRMRIAGGEVQLLNDQRPSPPKVNSSPSNNSRSSGSPAALASDENAVRAVVEGWAASLVRGNLDEHMAAYAETLDVYFQSTNVSRASIHRDKERFFQTYQRFEKNQLSFLHVHLASPYEAVAEFTKEWKATGKRSYSGAVRQRLRLRKFPAGWQIVSEVEFRKG